MNELYVKKLNLLKVCTSSIVGHSLDSIWGLCLFWSS